ncbi:MAG: hypothetical protein AAFW68_02220 [Pseudomonadota bacterium]
MTLAGHRSLLPGAWRDQRRPEGPDALGLLDMDALEFLLIIAVFAAVLFWYLQNEERNSDGLIGLFSLKDDPEIVKSGPRKSYRKKNRTARKPARAQDVSGDAPGVAYKSSDDAERMKRRFRAQDDARYKVKDKVAGFKSKPSPRPGQK